MLFLTTGVVEFNLFWTFKTLDLDSNEKPAVLVLLLYHVQITIYEIRAGELSFEIYIFCEMSLYGSIAPWQYKD